jgi:hypothetical protein
MLVMMVMMMMISYTAWLAATYEWHKTPATLCLLHGTVRVA